MRPLVSLLEGYSFVVVRLRLPNVDPLEDILVDCVMNPYLERSTLATMTNSRAR